MKKVIIKTINQKKIRNNGIGDYKLKKSHLEILVADMGDRKKEARIAIHELVEALLVEESGISFRAINKFDKKNMDRPGEPGEMRGAPYRKEHAVANIVERIMERELNKRSGKKA